MMCVGVPCKTKLSNRSDILATFVCLVKSKLFGWFYHASSQFLLVIASFLGLTNCQSLGPEMLTASPPKK
jgi:hypothetical protein